MPTKILVIDDEAIIRDLLQEFLSDLGYQVLLAEDGTKGIKLGTDNQISLALVDLKLPDIDGIQVIKKIREKNPHLKFILLTGFPTPPVKMEAHQLGASGFLTKPFQLPELQSLIQKALKGS